MEWFVGFFRELSGFLWNTYNFLAQMDFPTFIATFWAIIFLEVPRYVLTDCIVFLASIMGKFSFDQADQELKSKDNSPTISVILPVLNEEDTLRPTVESIYEQTYSNLEIFVIDDGSEDQTPKIGRKLSREGKIKFFRQEERQGKSAALNYGIQVSSSENIVFLDSDTTLDRDAIHNIVRHLQNKEVGAVCGNLGVRNWYRNPLTMVQSIEYLISITVGRCFRSLVGILPIVSGAFGAFPRSLIERVGGHEPGPGNDSDLTIRIRKLGKRIIFDPGANCLTNAPTSIISLIKQRLRWNRNVIRTRVFRHRDIFQFRSSNFRWRNFMSFLDTLFFSVVITCFWMVYVFDMFMSYPERFFMILFANYILHLLLKVPQVAIGFWISRRRATHLMTLLCLPLYTGYKIFLKFVRFIAIIQELFFRSSFNDPFAPGKVRQEMNRF